jgi:hypothetical protein
MDQEETGAVNSEGLSWPRPEWDFQMGEAVTVPTCIDTEPMQVVWPEKNNEHGQRCYKVGNGKGSTVLPWYLLRKAKTK